MAPFEPIKGAMSESIDENQRDSGSTSSGREGESAVASAAVDVSIIVVSYNTREMTLECLRSIVAETPDLAWEVLLVDNVSTDGSFEAIDAEFGADPRFHLVKSDENLGFAGGNNVVAGDARGEFLLLLNPDTVVLDRAIERLVAFARSHRDAGIWGGRTVFADGSLNSTSCWADMTLRGLLFQLLGLTRAFASSEFFNPEPYGAWPRDTVRRVDIVTGCFLLIERANWERLGGFDPAFFMYAEEADLAMRARANGARPLVTPDAVIVHHGSASEPHQAGQRVKVLKGKITLMHRHWSRWRRWLGVGILQVSVGYRALTYRLAGALARNEAWRARSAIWTEVWRRRREWRGGYPLEPRSASS